MRKLLNDTGHELAEYLLSGLNHLHHLPIGLNDVCRVGFWVLLTLAVFARPAHHRFIDDFAKAEDDVPA